MSTELISFFEKASAPDNMSGYDPNYFRAIGMIVPKNSGIQVINKDYHLTMHYAKNMHWRFMAQAIAMTKPDEYGMAAISSEGGAGIKAMQTQRQEQILQATNKSTQKPDAWDKLLYGDKKFENNDS